MGDFFNEKDNDLIYQQGFDDNVVIPDELSNLCKKIKEQFKDNVQKRQSSNYKIINAIIKLINEYPELRFGQILHMLNLHNIDFYEESIVTHKNLVKYTTDSVIQI